MRTPLRRAAAITAAGLLLLAAACGDDDDDDAADGATTEASGATEDTGATTEASAGGTEGTEAAGGGGDVAAAAQERVAPYLEPAASIGIEEPVEGEVPSDVSVYWLEGNIQSILPITGGFEEATDALGWDLTTLSYDPADPQGPGAAHAAGRRRRRRLHRRVRARPPTSSGPAWRPP